MDTCSFPAPEIVPRMRVGPSQDDVIVDRARFERLREFAAAAIAYSVARADALSENDFLDHLERIRRARVALLPADADPLP